MTKRPKIDRRNMKSGTTPEQAGIDSEALLDGPEAEASWAADRALAELKDRLVWPGNESEQD